MPAAMEGMSSALKKVMESEEKNKKSYKHQPPDGGWGWVIVIAYAIQNMILLPVLINFGLMFRDVFARLKMTTTDSSIIINVNSAAGLLFGLMNGPLLKTYGFRKVACVGALLTFFGNSMTSFSTSFYEFIIYYGIISSIGVALVMSSFSLALNTYFVERRGVATGIAMSFTGLGPIFMPLVISKLMTVYGARGTALIMGGLTLHSFVGAMLLQPVKWHYRKINEEIELQEKTDNTQKKNNIIVKTEEETPGQDSKEHQSQRISADETTLRGPPENLGSVHSLNISNNKTKLTDATTSDTKTVNNTEKSKSSEKEHNEKEDKYKVYKADERVKQETEVFLKSNGDNQYHEKNERENNIHNENMNKRTWKSRIVEFFDLDLLQEPIFRNIWIGMAIAFTAEMNFTLMTPFILGDMGYDTQSTAKIMSIMGTADILTRFTSPFIGQRTKLPARYLYLLSLCILVIFRFGLTVVDSNTAAIFVFIGLGIGKGFRSIYNSLVVPNHVRLEKLPSASGLQTVLNGICLMSFGPILGYIKDKIGNYNSYIHVLNILTLVTITLWVAEFIIRACKHRNR